MRMIRMATNAYPALLCLCGHADRRAGLFGATRRRNVMPCGVALGLYYASDWLIVSFGPVARSGVSLLTRPCPKARLQRLPLTLGAYTVRLRPIVGTRTRYIHLVQSIAQRKNFCNVRNIKRPKKKIPAARR